MQQLTQSRFFSYGIAIIAVLGAFLTMFMLDPWLPMVKSPFLLFLGAIVISAWYGGLKPGLLASLLSVALSNYFFLEPTHTLGVTLSEGIRIALYFLQGVIISLICEALQQAKRQAEVNLVRLKVSEERFRLALSNSNLYIFQQNKDLKYLWIHTPQGQVSPEEILGKSDYDIFSVQEAEHLKAIKEKALNSRQPIREEVCVTLDGNPHHYDLFVQPLQRSDEQACGITCVAVDITERKQIEQKLQSATEQSTQILESITDAFFALDQTWHFTYINRHFEEVTQYSREELLGKPIWAIFPEMMESIFYEEFLLAVEQNIPISIEATSPINPSDWIEARAYPSSEGLSVYWQNITERKKAEIERNQLLEREKAARAEAEIMQQRLAFLDTASTILAGSLDYQTTLQTVVNLLVPELADLCGLDIVQEDRSVNPLIALKAKDSQEEELVRHFTHLYPLDLNDINHPITRVFHTGSPETLDLITDDHYVAIAKDAQHLQYLRQLGMKSAICVPLKAHEEIFGVMTLALTKSERYYSSEDLRLALELGRRVGLAIENSRLHHQLQQATRQQEEYLALLNVWLASSPVALGFINKDLRYIYANQALATLNGLTLTETIERTLWEISPDYAPQLAPLLEQVMQKGEPLLNQELSSQTNPSGEDRCCLVNYYPVTLENGQILGVGVTAVDVTPLKQAEKAQSRLNQKLEAKQKLLEAVIQQMPAGLAIVESQNGRILLQNKQLHSILENRPLSTELLENYHHLYEVYHPNGQPYTIEELPLWRSRKQGEVVRSEEMRLVWTDGKSKTLLVDSSPIRNTQGEIEVAVATFYDITERKRTEEELKKSEARLILAQKIGKIGTCDWDLNTNQLIWTEEMEALYGMSPGTFDGKYETWLALIHPEDRNRLNIATQQLLTEGKEFDQEFPIILPDGKVRWIVAKATINLDKAGNIERVIGVNMDITDYKQILTELKNREEQLRLAVEGANLGMWNYDLISGELIWSDRCKKMFGISTTTQITYEIFINALHPEDRNRVDQAVQQSIAQKQNYDVEMRTQGSDGTLHWVRSIGHAYHDNRGVAHRMAGVVLDITHQKQAQEALRQSEERFRAAQELSLDAFTVLKSIRSQTGKIIDFEWTYVNPTAAKILNHPIEDLIGKRLLEVLPGNKSNGELFERYVKVVETGQSHDLELYYHSDGIDGWFRNMAVKLDDGVAVSFSDITERKRAEETLRENSQRLNIALRAAKLGSWHLDLSTMELYSSPEYKANFGLPPEADLSYSTLFELIHPEDGGYVSQSVQEAIQTHTDYEAEYRTIWPDGSIHWINSQGSVLYNNRGIALRIVGVNLDITARKLAQEEQKRLLEREKLARAEAEQVNRIKDEFLAVLSHELRSPLNPILGWAQLLRSKSFDKANQNRALEIIERNAKLQAQLIEDLLDVSRILRGKLCLNVTHLNLFFPIQGAIETVRLSAIAKSINIKTDLEPDIGQISGDAGRIQQIIWNLLSNAIKFTPEGGQIEISLERVNHQAQITVKDTGKGIDPNFLPYVFEHFRQADSTTTRKFGGLGLGLAIVRHLVEMHGGTVSAYSAGEGQGATFIVTFPLLKQEDTSTTGENFDLHPDLTEVSLKGIRILAVDDDADMRDYVTYVLQQSQAEVRVAASAREALAILSQFKPDVLLSDIGMPSVDGYRLLRQVRSLPPEQGQSTPAIALTAYAGEYDQRQAIAAGFARHLSKPVEPEQLVKAIVDLVNSQ